MRIIHIIGEINEESFKEFCIELEALERKASISDEFVEIHLRSDGGNPRDALAFVGRMRLSTFKFKIVGFGEVSSSALLILASGYKRLMTEESWSLVHEETNEISGETKSLAQEIKQIEIFEKQWNTMMAYRSKADANRWAAISSVSTYLSAFELLELGVIDEII